jgi:hypothetical protein
VAPGDVYGTTLPQDVLEPLTSTHPVTFPTLLCLTFAVLGFMSPSLGGEAAVSQATI